MHIAAELDDLHASRLKTLQDRLQKPLSEVLAVAIDAALAQEEAEPSPLYQALDAIGFIGCVETDEQLSSHYKEKLVFSDIHQAARTPAISKQPIPVATPEAG